MWPFTRIVRKLNAILFWEDMIMGSLDDLGSAVAQLNGKMIAIGLAVDKLEAAVTAGKNPDPAVQAKIDEALAGVNAALGKADAIVADAADGVDEAAVVVEPPVV